MRTTSSHARALPAALAALAALAPVGCSSLVGFDDELLAEKTPALCADGVDNDDNGLVDCQEFDCLGQEPCCRLPRILLSDDFEASPCSADPCSLDGGVPTRDGGAGCLDEAVWRPWGAPAPVVCEGMLLPRKRTACYEVGVIGRQALQLKSGLHVVAGVQGRPESKGFLLVGITRQSEAAGSSDECVPLEPVSLVLALQQRWSAGGYVFVAQFGAADVGTSAEVTDEERHVVALRVADDRRVHFLLDDREFAASPADLPLPLGDHDVFLVLAGRGLHAGFADVRVTSETQCETPADWVPPPEFLTFAVPEADSTAWDAYTMTFPAALRRSATVVELFYVGCRSASVGCEPQNRGVGRARSVGGRPFERLTPDKALLSVDELVSVGEGYDLSVALLPSGDATVLLASVASGVERRTLIPDDSGGNQVVVGPAEGRLLGPGGAGEWDSGGICCATAVRRDDGRVLLWYAGRDAGDSGGTWRIGLATAADGTTFRKHPENPVLQEGAIDGFDGRGVTEPEVVYDPTRALYRMWYGGHGLFGRTGVGYAVSVDGVVWHRYAGNPVVTDTGLGLEGIGSPAVISDEGEFRLWIHGRSPGSDRTFIYELRNRGWEYGSP